MAPEPLSVSVVVNTLDRAESLEALLEACGQLTHTRFEVVVVHGPCTDRTEEVVARWSGRIVSRPCPEANLSMSRNIGVAAAAGDVVAFIDDDGIPEPTWLDELCAAYADPEVGAVGGVVYNHTGHDFQVRFMLSDRLGNTTEFDEMPPGEFCFPGSARYPSMLGCNSSFRRHALVGIGGFDEEYDYYLDETDVCVRLVDAGWVIRPLDGAPVHHKYLPSGIRTRTKVVTDNRSVVKNKIYFSIVNGLGHVTWTDLIADDVRFAAHRRDEMHHQLAAGQIGADGHRRGLETVESGWGAGLSAGLDGRRRLLDPAASEQRELRAFPTTVAADRLRLVFLSRTLPPEQPGGVGRYMLDLARELARRGHEVRIVTSSPDHDRVDLEAGVWVHRIRKHTELPSPRHLPAVPEPLWPNAGAVAEEVLRISRERPVDVVLSSIWDVEWVGVFGSSSVPVVSAYTTPFSVVRATQPEAVQVSAAVADGIESLERWAHGAAHAVQANGEHIVEAVEQSSGVRFDPAGLFVAPLGSGDPVDRRGVVGPVAPNGIAGVDRPFTVLFVGRFERRKGIDLLLDAIAPVIAANPSVRFVLAGPDDLPDGSGSTHRARFEAAHPDLVAAGSVRFTGPVDGDELAVLLGEADAAVLPSRFESFGLVYVEAMAAGLPVVALADSGAEEVVTAGVTGFLCPPDPEGLAAAILALAADPVEAAELGRRGRGRFEREFTVEAMADRFLALFSAVRARRPGSPEWPADTDRLVRLADGNPGHRLERGEQMRLDVPRGRCTVVVAGLGDADPSSVAVVAGGQEALVEVRGEEFHHVVLRTGAAEVEVSVRSGPPVGLAALVVADAADGVGE
jgi:glycosyltransferase involved in cell wall biosynthesis/GT2 family glycosyltransferase